MERFLKYFTREITPAYKKNDIPLIVLTIVLITTLLITINLLGKENIILRSLAAELNNNRIYEVEENITTGNVTIVSDPGASGGEYAILGESLFPSPTPIGGGTDADTGGARGTQSPNGRVEIPTKAVFTMQFSNNCMYVDGCLWPGSQISQTDGENGLYYHIADGAQAGVTAFLYDATSNVSSMIKRGQWLNTAARRFNSEHPNRKVCISPMYEETGSGALALFDAMDAGGTDSPLCTIDGNPVVAVWGNGTCLDPLPDLAARGPLAMVGTVYNTPENYPTASCVSNWRNSGATKVLSYLWTSGNGNFASSWQSKMNSILATGADEFILGIGSARSENCGEGCSGPKSTDYQLHDMNGYVYTLTLWRAVWNATSPINKVMYTLSFPGDAGEGSYHDSALVCDNRDMAPHNLTIGGFNTNFTCPNIPDHLKGTIPTSHYKSYSAKLFTHRGFWRIDQEFARYFNFGNEPPASTPFIAWSYREHPFDMPAANDQICSSGNSVTTGNLGGQFWGDNIFLTSFSDNPVHVRVKFGTNVAYDGTLPAKQIFLDTASRQVAVPFGSYRGRPVFEILDTNGNITKSTQGLVQYTDQPIQRDGKVGRNFSLYADFLNI